MTDHLPDLALSVRQPWAWAIILAGKDVENRSWQAVNHGLNVRGRIAIHASKGMKRDEYEATAAFMRSIGVECPPAADLLRGGIIGSVEVIDVVKESDSRWFFGPRGLVLANPLPCEFKPCSGALGYFYWRKRPVIDPVRPACWMLSEEHKPKEELNLFSEVGS
nr:ASCH domain-containing protein [uncultured Cohaesibacter sp.]